MTLRRQLPAYSPITARSLLAAARDTIAIGRDPRAPLRELLRSEFGSNYVVLCGSGTQALSLAIHEALDRSGAESIVAIPVFSCFDIASAVIGAGVTAALYDLDPRTLGPDYDSLERVLDGGVRVAVVAPLYGVPLDWNALSAIAARHEAILIEDAAQGQGARWDSKRVGARGDIAILSFGRGKGWTGGHGGALLLKGVADSSETELAGDNFADDFTTLIGLAAQWLLGRPAVYAVPQSIPGLRLGETVYRRPTRPVCLGRAAAATILATKAAAEGEAATRKANAEKLLVVAEKNPHITRIAIDALSDAGYLRLPLRLPRGLGSFADAADARSLGVTGSYPALLADLPQLAGKVVGRERSWPGGEALVRELVTVPVHSLLDEDDIRGLEELILRARG